ESSGPHSNGFSLLRKLFLKEGKHLPDDAKQIEFLREDLLRPTRIYVEPVLKVLQKEEIKGMVHITGGGFHENIPRILQDGTSAALDYSKIPLHPVFQKISKDFQIEMRELFSTFNMGVGYIVITSKENAETVRKEFEMLGEGAHIIGEIVSGKKEVIIS
ncbi:MAG TPA: AIR synthase-related protein, partial [Leptospiraceae bacterium]|nr:AIR synthase-related protein [Leptospiraceae bacterium]